MIEISVIVATVGRPERLERLLKCLAEQDVAAMRFELVVVIDGTSPESEAVLRAWSPRFNALRWEATGLRRGPAAARNRAWRATCGPIVAMTDDDCEPDPGWLRAFLTHFEAHPEVGVLIGRTTTDRSRLTPFSHYVENLNGEGHQTCNSAYRRDVLEAIGGFDERFPAAYLEDTDLYCRATEISAAEFAPTALVYHPPREASVQGLAQSARKFESDFIFFRKNPKLYASRHLNKGPLATVLWDVGVKHVGKQLLQCLSWLPRNPALVIRFWFAMLLFDCILWSHAPIFYVRHLTRNGGLPRTAEELG